MTSTKGMYSYRTNPVPAAKNVKPGTGPALGASADSDQMKVNSLRAKAYQEKDSLRGKNGI